jgi:hypothetical protein
VPSPPTSPHPLAPPGLNFWLSLVYISLILLSNLTLCTRIEITNNIFLSHKGKYK